MTHEGQTGVVFESGGHKLLGTLFVPRDPGPHPTALLLHGIPGIEKNVDLAHHLRENGWASLLIHYRGCWGSEGDYRLQTIPDDVIAAIDYLHAGAHPEVDPSRLAIIGHSLGGWAAILAAARDDRPRAVVVYGAVADPTGLPFTVTDAAAEFTPWLHGIPPDDFVQQWTSLGDPFSPVHEVHHITPRPLLIIHGKQDGVVPVTQAHALAEATPGPVIVRVHPEGNHAFAWHRPWLRGEIFNWLASLDL